MAKSNFYVKSNKAYDKKSGKLIGVIFHKQGFTTNALDGKQRLVTVVGIRTKIKERVVDPIHIKNSTIINDSMTSSGDPNYHEVTEGLLLTPKTEYSTLFKFGYAICNPEDRVDACFGFHLAVKRALGAKRTLTSNSFSLLGDDRCIALVDNEYEYITKNIDKYLLNVTNGKY